MNISAETSKVSFTKDDYFKMLTEMYQSQSQMSSSGNPIIDRLRIAAQNMRRNMAGKIQ